MEVEVRLFATFRVGRWKSKRLSLSENTHIKDVLDLLQINPDEIGMILVNGSYKTIEHKLNDGDILAVFPPVAGG
jgi:molybdopterin converting factor small subunit